MYVHMWDIMESQYLMNHDGGKPNHIKDVRIWHGDPGHVPHRGDPCWHNLGSCGVEVWVFSHEDPLGFDNLGIWTWIGDFWIWLGLCEIGTKQVFVWAWCLFSLTLTYGLPGSMWRMMFNQRKCHHITGRYQITSKRAEMFWPIPNLEILVAIQCGFWQSSSVGFYGMIGFVLA